MQSLKAKDEACMNYATVYDAQILVSLNEQLKRIEAGLLQEWKTMQYKGMRLCLLASSPS